VPSSPSVDAAPSASATSAPRRLTALLRTAADLSEDRCMSTARQTTPQLAGAAPALPHALARGLPPWPPSPSLACPDTGVRPPVDGACSEDHTEPPALPPLAVELLRPCTQHPCSHHPFPLDSKRVRCLHFSQTCFSTPQHPAGCCPCRDAPVAAHSRGGGRRRQAAREDDGRRAVRVRQLRQQEAGNLHRDQPVRHLHPQSPALQMPYPCNCKHRYEMHCFWRRA